MRLAGARHQRIRSNLAFSNARKQFHFANRTDSLLTVKEAHFHEVPICGHVVSPIICRLEINDSNPNAIGTYLCFPPIPGENQVYFAGKPEITSVVVVLNTQENATSAHLAAFICHNSLYLRYLILAA